MRGARERGMTPANRVTQRAKQIPAAIPSDAIDGVVPWSTLFLGSKKRLLLLFETSPTPYVTINLFGKPQIDVSAPSKACLPRGSLESGSGKAIF